MNHADIIAGLVLAGGRSSRFGCDKALAALDTRTLLQVGMERFSPCSVRAVAVRGEGAVADHAQALGAEVIQDPPGAAEGPLAGIAAGLVWARANGCELLAVAPCDAPLLCWRHYELLLSALGDAPAAFAATGASEHPLCAVWRVDLTAPLRRAMAGGKHPPVHRFLHESGAVAVAFDDSTALANANTAEELAQIAAEVRR